MTEYTDVISLNDAKIYLGVDDASRNDEITRIIGSALSWLEKKTNIIVIDGDRSYRLKDGCVRVYDFPINTLEADLASTQSVEVYSTYSVYTDTNTENKTITLDVGHGTLTSVPNEWIECGYALIECLFEGGKLSDLPDTIKMMVNSLKRFII